MKKILRYLFFKNFNTLIIILSIITLLLIILQSLRLFDLIINRGFSISNVAYLAILSMPKMWVELLPFTIIISTIFTWNQMLSNNEITTMRSVGISSWQLASTTILISAFFSLVAFIFTGWLIPRSYESYYQLRSDISNQYNLKLIEQGKFNNIGNDITFYVKQIRGNEFNNIIIYSERNPQKPVTIYAEKGVVDMQNSTLILLLDKASIIERNIVETSVSFFSVDKYIFDFNLAPKKINVVRNQPDELYLQELLWQQKERLFKDIKEGSPAYEKMDYKTKKEIIRRISNSILTLILGIVSVFFFANNYFHRTGGSSPILKSLLATIGLKIATLIALFSNINILTAIFLVLVIPISIAIALVVKIIFPPSLKKMSKQS